MDTIDLFMAIYMFELEIYLNSKIEEIKTVSFQSDEANTDRPLKEFLKSTIENSFNRLPISTNFRQINFLNETINIKNSINEIFINKVLLPEDVNDTIKQHLVLDSSKIFTNPDLCLEIYYNDAIYYRTIELKSTKNDSIPGSSIQQINPNEWVIFIKHTSSNQIEIATGQYLNAINSKMEFPDRSPRPQVSFSELQKWNISNRIINNDILIYQNDPNSYLKKELITDWQKVLVDRWIETVFRSNYQKQRTMV